MSLGDVSGVFSRYFVVGFFLPAFFALFVLALAGSVHLRPSYIEPRSQSGVLVIGGAALLLGLLLLGLNYPIIRIFEGYPLRRFTRVWGWLVERQARPFDDLNRKVDADIDGDDTQRSRAAANLRDLDERYPSERAWILPTRFGNAMRAFESYSKSRWGLDPIATWPRLDPLLSDAERELHTVSKTDLAFFLNACLASFGLGIALVVDEAVHVGFSGPADVLYVLPFLATMVFYRFAVEAATHWGTEVRASVDLHRLELYDRLGIRRPTGFEDERANVAPHLNRFFLYGEPLPETLFAADERAGRGAGGG